MLQVVDLFPKNGVTVKIANHFCVIYQSISKNGPDRLRRNPDRAVLLIRMNTHSHYILISETTPNFQKLAVLSSITGQTIGRIDAIKLIRKEEFVLH